MKKLFLPILILFCLNTLLIAQLTVKDQEATPHTLMQVNDEGVAGSITLNQLTIIGTPASKLYNLGGVLHWAGSPLATGSSSQWTTNGSNIYYSTGNVGIGTTNPIEKLHLLGDFRIEDTNPYLNFYSGSTLMGLIGFWTDNNLNIINKGVTSNIVLATNSTEKMRITASGNVGIGTNNPTFKFQVSGGSIKLDNSYGLKFAASNGYHPEIKTNNNDLWISNQASGVIRFLTGAELGAGYSRMVIDEDGNVGIGTNDEPLSKLSVGGIGISGVAIYSETDDWYGIYGKATNTGAVQNYGGYFQANGAFGYGVYGIATSTTSTINYGGYFIAYGNSGQGVYGESIGTGGRGVYGKALTYGEFTNYGGYFEAASKYSRGVYGESTGSDGVGAYGKATGNDARGVRGNASGTNGIGVYGYASGINGKGVVGHGNVTNTSYDFDAIGVGVDYGSTSSRRWKKDIKEIENPLDKLSKLRGVYFNWDEGHGGHHDIGCIAEEVGKVLPEIVVYEENGIDADGMDYSRLTPLLIESIKEQQKMIEDLQKEVELLKQNN